MLRVLGGVEIDGRGPIRSRGQRILLGALALDAGRVVSSDRLAELIWRDERPANPGAALQNHVSRVRRILPDGCTIAADGAGYRLDVADASLDLAAFDARFEAACATEVADRLDDVERALALWSGEPFRELEDDRAVAERARLAEQHLVLREMRAEDRLASGRPRQAIADLEALCRDQPLRERTVELLMHAHVDAEDKARALQVYGRLRGALVEELGLDPSPALRALEAAILTEERIASTSSRTDGVAAPVGPGGAPRAPTVPVPASSFVGREEVLDRLATLLATERVVTVAGPGGVGKTRLAVQAVQHTAAAWPWVSMVDLSRVLVPEQVAHVVASQLGLQPRSDVSDVARIVDAVGSRRSLILLDNCEHIIDAAAELVVALTSGSPVLTVCATSREPLGLPDEHVIRLSPLDVTGAAVTLFVDRASAAMGGHADDGLLATDVVADICRLVDGLPLAIELVASRCASASLEELRESLAEPMSALAPRRRPGHRHGSLRSLVEWSARDLDGELTRVFNGASVFAGPFTAADVASVVDIPMREASASLVELAERSLLVVHASGPGARTRFRCLATIRSYASEQLAADEGGAAVAARHRAWVLDLCEAAHAALTEPGGGTAYQAVIGSMAEVRVVHARFLESGDADGALRLAAALHLVLLVQMQSEVGDWIMETADRFGDVAHPSGEQVLALASMAAWLAGDLDRSTDYAASARRAAASSDHVEAGRAAREASADLETFLGDSHAALCSLEQALEIARTGDNRFRVITNLADSALTAGYVGAFDTARARIAEARELLADDAAPALRSWVAYAEGEGLADDDPERALAALSEAIDLARECGAAFVTGVAGLTRVGLQVRSGRLAEAVPGMVELLRHWRSAGAWVQQWIALRTAVEVLVGLGRYDAAAVVLAAVLDSGSATEVSGADASRMEAARAEIEAELPDADARFARGRGTDRWALVDDVIALLESHLTAT